jgi:hypothetical protein
MGLGEEDARGRGRTSGRREADSRERKKVRPSFCLHFILFRSRDKKVVTVRANSPSRTSSTVSQTAAGGGEAAGEHHPGNLVAGGIPRRDLFLWVSLPWLPKEPSKCFVPIFSERQKHEHNCAYSSQLLLVIMYVHETMKPMPFLLHFLLFHQVSTIRELGSI